MYKVLQEVSRLPAAEAPGDLARLLPLYIRFGVREAMTEADLGRLLQVGARRIQLQRALRLGLGALGGGILLATLGIFLLRLFPISGAMPGAQMTLIQLALALPVLFAAIIAVAAFSLTRPDSATVALLLDRRAESKEHLVTWFEFSRRSAGIEPGFRAAQLAATLQRAPALNPRTLLPLRLPEWTRALWLALLMLCSALLMPPRVDAARTTNTVRESRQNATLQRSITVSPESAAAEPRRAPYVQPLTPTEKLKMDLQLSDPDMSTKEKAELLKELEKKISNVPETELDPELRDVLAKLRAETGAKTPEIAKPEIKDGSQQSTGAQGKTDVNPLEQNGGVDVKITERAFTQIGQSFPDVKSQLELYYMAKPVGDKK